MLADKPLDFENRPLGLSCQYCSTSRANQALRSQVFKIEGFVCKRFLPSPPPPPSFIFWLSFHFSRGQNRKSRSSVFFCSETKRKRLLRIFSFSLYIFKNHIFIWATCGKPSLRNGFHFFLGRAAGGISWEVVVGCTVRLI